MKILFDDFFMTPAINKYKIDEYLNSLTIKEYRKAIQLIPRILGVSLNTFQNYRNILIGDVQDIPYEKVIILEKLFDYNPGSLSNQQPEVERLKNLF